MLSQACKNAIRSVLFLSIHSSESNKLGVKRIAEELETPQPFLAKQLQALSKSKIISSTKGLGGGFFMKNENLNKTLWDVVITIDGTDKLDGCFLGLQKCSDVNPCPVHFTVAPFRKKLLHDFQDKTIQQFADEIKLKGRFLSLKDLNPPHFDTV